MKKIFSESKCHDILRQFKFCLESLREEKAIEFFAKKFSKYANVVVAENKENKIIGFIVYYANDFNSRSSFITMIATLPEFRGMHVGQLLLNFCKKDIRSKGFLFIKLEVRKENLAAQKFYEKNGFIIISEKEKYMMEWKEL